MIRYRDQVALALRAIAVTSPTSYAWFGRKSRPLTPAVVAALGPGAAREILIGRLEKELYRSFYRLGRPLPLSPPDAPGRSDQAFVEALSSANAGLGGWEPGWRIEQVQGDALLVARKGLRVRVPGSECRPVRAVHRLGTSISVARPNEHLAASPGFYTALGDAQPAATSGEIEVRVYFNVTAAGAEPLVAAVTTLLNRRGVPFSLKILDHPARFLRCDAAVVYLHQGDFRRARGALGAIVSACAAYLRDDTPAFTKPLAPGVAIGEHGPTLGGSFGTSRCRLVAKGVVGAHDQRTTRLSGRLDAVDRAFAECGLDLDLPYLAPASIDRYVL